MYNWPTIPNNEPVDDAGLDLLLNAGVTEASLDEAVDDNRQPVQATAPSSHPGSWFAVKGHSRTSNICGAQFVRLVHYTIGIKFMPRTPRGRLKPPARGGAHIWPTFAV